MRVFWLKIRNLQLTSRSTKLLATSLPIDHGIGRVVVTFKALLNPKASVNSSSTPAWIATPRQILNRLKPITWYHCGLPPFRDFFPPVLVGRASVPWVLKLTATLGIIESNTRNKSEGTKKNKLRMARVPTTSTFNGGWLRTRVLHVWCHH